MSMQLSSVDDDMEDLAQSSARRNISSLSGRYQPSRSNQNKDSYHIIYIGIIAILSIVIFVLYFNNNPVSTQSETSKQLKELSQQVNQLKGSAGASVTQIQDLKKEVSKINTNKPQPQQPSIPQQKPATPPPQPPPASPNKNRPKNEYMTPELEKVGERRRQAGGMKQVKSGSVSQMNYLKKNKDGKSIEELLYTDEPTKKFRTDFQKTRVQFLSGKANMQSIYLASFNNKINQDRNAEQERVQAQQYARIDKIWNFAQFKQELPMCLIVPGYNNNAKFRIQYNLNSIFQQNYTNYFAVIINDASTDGSDQVYRKYLDFYNIDKSTYAYVEKKDRKTALENIYMATHDYCSPDSIAINLDADDEFIGKNVLKIFNAAYQSKKAGVVYSNFYWYDQGRNIMLGFTSEYTESDKKNKNYRQAPQRFSHLRTYRSQLFLQIDAKNSFQDDQGKFFTSAYDMAMYFPLMELSCGRVNKIEGFHYLYNINTGLNDYAVDRNKQVRIDQTVRRRPKYNCSLEFDQRMKKS